MGLITTLTPVLFEVLLHFESGHAARSCGGNGLAVTAVLYVSAGEDAGNAGMDLVVGDDVAIRVEIDLAGEHFGVRFVADSEKEPANGQRRLAAGCGVAQAEAGDFLLLDTEDLFDGGVGHEGDSGVADGALQHDLGGAELLAPMQQRYLGGEAGEEERFFHGGIASADHGNLFAGEEEAVAGSAGADAVTDEGLLGGQSEPARRGSAGDDEGAGVNGLAAEIEREGALGEIDGDQVTHAEVGAEARGLLLHVLDELRALNPFGPSGEVFDQGGDGELASGLVAFEDERLEVGARGIDGGGEAGATGAEDDGIANIRHGQVFPIVTDCASGHTRLWRSRFA